MVTCVKLKPAAGLKCFERDVSLTGCIGTDKDDRTDPRELAVYFIII